MTQTMLHIKKSIWCRLNFGAHDGRELKIKTNAAAPVKIVTVMFYLWSMAVGFDSRKVSNKTGFSQI